MHLVSPTPHLSSAVGTSGPPGSSGLWPSVLHPAMQDLHGVSCRLGLSHPHGLLTWCPRKQAGPPGQLGEPPCRLSGHCVEPTGGGSRLCHKVCLQPRPPLRKQGGLAPRRALLSTSMGSLSSTGNPTPARRRRGGTCLALCPHP